MMPSGGYPSGLGGLPWPVVALDPWPQEPRVGDLIPAGFTLRDASGETCVAVRLRGRALRLAAVLGPRERRFELLVDARGRVVQVRLTPSP